MKHENKMHTINKKLISYTRIQLKHEIQKG